MLQSHNYVTTTSRDLFFKKRDPAKIFPVPAHQRTLFYLHVCSNPVLKTAPEEPPDHQRFNIPRFVFARQTWKMAKSQ
jgi:hypothetical protein